MQARKIGGEGEQTYALMFDEGDELIETLLEFARARHIRGAHFEGVGTLTDVVLGFWDREARRHRPIGVEGEMEIVSLVGDVVIEGDHSAVRAHLVGADAEGLTHGGQVLRARVHPRLELLFQQTPRHLCRRIDPETGLALLEADAPLR